MGQGKPCPFSFAYPLIAYRLERHAFIENVFKGNVLISHTLKCLICRVSKRFSSHPFLVAVSYGRFLPAVHFLSSFFQYIFLVRKERKRQTK